MFKHIQIKALKDGATVAGISLKSGQIVGLDLDAAQLADAKGNADLAVDEGKDDSSDLSLAKHADSTNTADNAPKSNGPMYGIGIVEKTVADATDDAATVELKSKNKSK